MIYSLPEQCWNIQWFVFLNLTSGQNCQASSFAHSLPQSKSCTHASYPPPLIVCFTVCNFAKTSPLIIHCQKCHLLLNDSCAADRETVGSYKVLKFPLRAQTPGAAVNKSVGGFVWKRARLCSCCTFGQRVQFAFWQV